MICGSGPDPERGEGGLRLPEQELPFQWACCSGSAVKATSLRKDVFPTLCWKIKSVHLLIMKRAIRTH